MRRILIFTAIVSLNALSCQDEYRFEAIYMSVIGDYGVGFEGTYGNAFEWHAVSGVTPEYYPFELEENQPPFVADFKIATTSTKNRKTLVVMFYLLEQDEPLKLIARREISDPDSNITFTYPE